MSKPPPNTRLQSPDNTEPPPLNAGGRLFRSRPAAYIGIIVAVILGTFVYSIRMHGIFSCQANGYGSDRYAAYCQATKYGDYDHGAFWFDLEPDVIAAARDAEVLFIGNSRMQFGFSSKALSEWSSSRRVSHFLLGFSHDGNYNFAGPLLQRLSPRAKVYVLNLDLFFEKYLSPPVKTITGDPMAKSRYEQKRSWQRIHRFVCKDFPAICGDEIAFFRSRDTGHWLVQGGRFEIAPVSYDDHIDPDVLEAYSSAGKEFLFQLPVDRDCVILTMVPKPGAGLETAKAIADTLGVNLIAPKLDGLMTFDGSHLDEPSRERWSAAFVEAAGPQIRACLDNTGDSPW